MACNFNISMCIGNWPMSVNRPDLYIISWQKHIFLILKKTSIQIVNMWVTNRNLDFVWNLSLLSITCIFSFKSMFTLLLTSPVRLEDLFLLVVRQGPVMKLMMSIDINQL